MIRIAVMTCLMLLCGGLVYAEGKDDKGAQPAEATGAAIYIPLRPEFVVNYGDGHGKNKFLRAEITVRLANSAAADSVRHHLPYIRNQLVFLFSSQTDETLQSQDGREAMREQALQEVRDVLNSEDGLDPKSVVDVLFNALTWQG